MLSYSFGKLTAQETGVLLNKYTYQKYKATLAEPIQNMIITYSDRIPRNLLKLTDFVFENNVTEEELRDYVQDISDSVFLNLFALMRDKDAGAFYTAASNLFAKRDAYVIVQKLKDFLINVLYYVEGGVSEHFTRMETQEVKVIFPQDSIMRIVKVVETLPHNVTEADLMLALLNMRLVLQKRTTKDVLIENKKISGVERINVNEVVADLNETESKFEQSKLTKLDLTQLAQFR